MRLILSLALAAMLAGCAVDPATQKPVAAHHAAAVPAMAAVLRPRPAVAGGAAPKAVKPVVAKVRPRKGIPRPHLEKHPEKLDVKVAVPASAFTKRKPRHR